MAVIVRAVIVLLAITVVACGGSTVEEKSEAVPASPAIPILPTLALPTPTSVVTCSTKDGRKVRQLIESVARRWDDALELAQSTPRIQLAAQISNLQQIRRDLEDQDWPDCAASARRALVTAMNAAIDGLIAFMADKPDTTVSGHFRDYAAAMDWFTNEMATLR
ncbi:MAG TPA: hypothetical protein DEU95_13860 [Chloroflexi bacterium]|nr:hypothetical protein [Chloroflexota bacterium]